MEYDENKAIDYILERLEPGADGHKVDSDEVVNVIDIIFDYYEDHGLLDIDGDDDVDRAALFRHVRKLIAADRHSTITPDQAEAIARLELDYEDTVDL